jgi:hypothetical protein
MAATTVSVTLADLFTGLNLIQYTRPRLRRVFSFPATGAESVASGCYPVASGMAIDRRY